VKKVAASGGERGPKTGKVTEERLAGSRSTFGSCQARRSSSF